MSVRALDAETAPGEDLPSSILQFGTGNFLRAFADQMIQRAGDAGLARHGITIVRTTDGASAAVDALRAQDGRFHVLLEGLQDGRLVREFTLVTCVRSIVSAPDEFERYRDAYLSPELEIVISNTTEAGIVWVPDDDLDARPPASFPGKMTALLRDRYERFGGSPDAGLHIVCCELIEDNASTLRAHVLRHATRAGLGDGFLRWVRESCHFHDSLVDRIVPGFPGGEIAAIQDEIGYSDQCLVKAELFGLWAIAGDRSLAEVLPLDRAGLPVHFVDDIAPIRTRKVRVLNGLHTALAAVGLAHGHRTVRDAMGDPRVAGFVRGLLDDEIIPSIPGDPAEVVSYADAILERFANPALEHRLTDIALNSLAKWRARILPVVLDGWSAGRGARRGTFVLAQLLVLYADGGGVGFEPRDDEEVVRAVREGLRDADRAAGVRDIIVATGVLPAADAHLDRLVAEICGHLDRLDRAADRAAAIGGATS